VGSNVGVVQSAYDAFARGDISAVIDLLDEDIKWSSPSTLPQGGHFHGKGGVGDFFQGVGSAWSALALDIECVADAGDGLVIGVLRASGTRQEGTKSGYGAAHVFTVHDGKIARFREYTDLDEPL